MAKSERALKYKDSKSSWKRLWYFVWYDDSIWSWLLNVVIAFILIKFIVYPGLGFMLSTSHPIVAVVSSSMEHHPSDFAAWFSNDPWYLQHNISQEQFLDFKMRSGFSRGDIIVLKGRDPKDIKAGDIIVFQANRPYPIIHRVVNVFKENDIYYFQTKGDNNKAQINDNTINELRISQNQVIGTALFKIPYLGYVKILFTDLIQSFTN